MHPEDHIDAPTTRRSFIRRVGKTIAIGLGVALVPVTNAWAPQDTCCPNSSCHCAPGAGNPFFCNGSCGGCCACLTNTSCVTFSGGCPC